LATVRRVLLGWLAELGFSDAVAQDLVLATNEAASNAVEHAYPGAEQDCSAIVTVSLWVDPRDVHIEVVDRGVWRPVPTGPTGRGRGIPLMHQLVRFVEIRGGADGTTTLLRHPLPATAAAGGATS
jgi:anti-sigma regulatory factor (Ser/Thr protein kinase)